MDLAEDGSEDGTSTPAKEHPSTIPPATTQNDAGTTPPAPNVDKAGTATEKPSNLKQMATPMHNRPATPSSKSSSSDDDNGTEDEEYVSCLLQWLPPDSDCKRMLHNVMYMLAHHKRNIRNKAVSIFQQAVNEYPKLVLEARDNLTAALYTMRETRVRFDSRLRTISYLRSGQGNRNPDKQGGSRMRVHKEWVSLCFSFEFMVILWVYICVFPLGLCYSYGLSGLHIWLYETGEVSYAQRAREELWREHPFLTTPTTQLDRGLSYSGCMEI